MVTSLIRPSYSNGFARSAGESIKPNEWRGLVGAWKMSLGPTGTILRDFSGKGNHGSLTNMDSATDWVISGNPKLPGYCLDFDGTNDYVVSNLNKTTIGNLLSISFWVRPTGNQNLIGIFSMGGSATDGTAWINCQRRAPTSDIRWYLAGNYRIVPTSISDNTWYHFGLTYDGTTWVAYKDGQSAGSYVGPIGSFDGEQTWIGSGYNGFFNGRIDDVRIYNRALNAQEIRDMYNYPNAMYTLRDRYSFMSVPAAGAGGGLKAGSLSLMGVGI